MTTINKNHFAKIFTSPNEETGGMVLVRKSQNRDNGQPLLVIECYRGVDAQMVGRENGYEDVAQRDAAFEAMDETAAREVINEALKAAKAKGGDDCQCESCKFRRMINAMNIPGVVVMSGKQLSEFLGGEPAPDDPSAPKPNAPGPATRQ